MGKTGWLVGAGALIGILALILAANGNPPNMGVCVACFLRDTAGGLKLQSAPPVQYMRPEIFGFALGASVSALAFKEFLPRAGSVPVIRFILGFFMMIGCLVFLGCPLRVFLRIGAGDLNAIVGLLGLAFGIWIGTIFMQRGDFTLPANQEQRKTEGLIFPVVCLIVLLLSLILPELFAASKAGPGSMHAPVIYALIAGLVIGVVVERTRFCSIGFISHIILFKRFSMMIGVMALILVVFVGNLYLGKFKLGFDMQPIAHTDGLWNFLSMALVGVCGLFLGGCPLRQIVKAGKGDGDATMTVFGMLLGAAVAHNFSIVSAAQSATAAGGATAAGKIFVVSGLILVAIIGVAYSCCCKNKEQKAEEASAV